MPNKTRSLNKEISTKVQSCFWHLRRGTPVSLAKMQRDKNVGIIYLDEKSRSHYELEIKQGEFSEHSRKKLNDTHHLLFGLDRTGKFYGKLGFEWKNYGRGYFGHGSFLAGRYLMGEGELLIKKGKLCYLTSNSGHYLPGKRNMRIVLYHLHKSGVDLRNVTLILYNHKRTFPVARGHYSSADIYNAMEFLEKHESNCSKYNHVAESIKKDIQEIRTFTNNMISQTDSAENTKPHRLLIK